MGRIFSCMWKHHHNQQQQRWPYHKPDACFFSQGDPDDLPPCPSGVSDLAKPIQVRRLLSCSHKLDELRSRPRSRRREHVAVICSFMTPSHSKCRGEYFSSRTHVVCADEKCRFSRVRGADGDEDRSPSGLDMSSRGLPSSRKSLFPVLYTDGRRSVGYCCHEF